MKGVDVDVAVIGAGTAGLAAYRAARAAGARVVLIEGGHDGTTCARVGCMPSKLLIAAADAAHAVRRASAFGVDAGGPPRIDGPAVMARLQHERDRFVGGVLRELHEIPAAERLAGQARFSDDHTLEVAGQARVSARSIVIATGSSAVRPAAFAALGDRVIVSDAVFDWPDLPPAVAVIGAGIVGLELAQALHRLGVRVAVFGRGGKVGPIGDPEIRAVAVASFNEEFSLDTDADIAAMEVQGDRVAIRCRTPEGGEVGEDFDHVLAATGRTPNVKGIGLERTSLSLDAAGVPLSDRQTTRSVSSAGASPIFIAGDAADAIPLLHEAADEGRIAGGNAAALALGRPVAPGLRRARLAIVFTDPQIAIVGGGYRSLKPGSFATGRVSFFDQGRSRILLRNSGLMNVYGDFASGRFRGAEMLSPGAEHLAHLLAWALQNNMTPAEMLEMPFYHPVIEEGLRTALRDLDRQLRSGRAEVVRAA